MADLAAAFEELGYEDVGTYIASGNVLFTATGKPATLERAIEPELARTFGFEIPTMVRTAARLRKAVELEPFGPVPDGHRWYVNFLRRKPTAAEREAVEALATDVDRLVVDGAELHQLIRGGQTDSTIKAKALAIALGDNPSTNRNSTMLRKLAAKL
jgi:uncharacterized protein (DUF1697 family)